MPGSLRAAGNYLIAHVRTGDQDSQDRLRCRYKKATPRSRADTAKSAPPPSAGLSGVLAALLHTIAGLPLGPR